MKMCIDSPEDKETRRLNKEIEKRLKRDKDLARKEVKLLLLGTGESGKSTFMKQMKIIHEKGFSVKELEEQRKYVFHNSIVCMQTILMQMTKLQIALETPQNKAHAERLLTLAISYENVGRLFPEDHLPVEYVTSIECLWADRGVRLCFDRRNDYHLSDSAEYFFSNVTRYGQPGYLPNEQDMLRIRLPTTGIAEHCFRFRKKIWLRIVDVGGQQSERRKWIHCFDCVKSIIFLTALNEYDMFFKASHQHRGKTRMQESLELFRLISNIKVLANASFILFLNKKDLFEEKITSSPLRNFFPEYDGPNEMEEAGNFIKHLFITHAFGGVDGDSTPGSPVNGNGLVNNGVNHGPQRPSWSVAVRPEPKHIYAHFTCATDTKNIKFVFDSVKHTILQDNVREIFPDSAF